MPHGNRPKGRPQKPKNAGFSGRVPFSPQFGEWASQKGIPTHNLRFGDFKPKKAMGKRNNPLIEKDKAARRDRKRKERISNKRGRFFELFFGKSVLGLGMNNSNGKTKKSRKIHSPDKMRDAFIYVGRDAENGTGMDFISNDGKVRIEIKGTHNKENGGTFDSIKTVNGQLANKIATHFVFMTPRQMFICDANRLRDFVSKQYSQLDKFQYPNDKYVRVKLEIDRLVRAGVFATPSGHVQGWAINLRRMRLLQPLANKFPLPKPPRTMAMPFDRNNPDTWPTRSGMGRRLDGYGRRPRF